MRWRDKFMVGGVGSVGTIGCGRGRKPWLAADTVAEVVRVTQHELPDDGARHGVRLRRDEDAVHRFENCTLCARTFVLNIANTSGLGRNG